MLGQAPDIYQAYMNSHHVYFGQFDPDNIREVIILRPMIDPLSDELDLRVKRQDAARKTKALRRKIKNTAKPKIVLNVPLILPEVLNLPRLPETGPLGGCATIHKGHTESGGFFVFTCEKLRPKVSIAQHEIIAHRYRVLLREAGWKKSVSDKLKTTSHNKTDAKGCRLSVDVTVWDDRVMGEPVLNREDRDSYRQIVFLTSFQGKPCEPYYETVKTLSRVKQN